MAEACDVDRIWKLRFNALNKSIVISVSPRMIFTDVPSSSDWDKLQQHRLPLNYVAHSTTPTSKTSQR